MIAYPTDVSTQASAHAQTAGAAPQRAGSGTLALSLGLSDVGDRAPPDTVVILYATDTTAALQGVMLTHGPLMFGGITSAELRDIGPDDVICGTLPMTHGFGLASMRMAASHAGAAIQLEARFRPDSRCHRSRCRA